MKEIIKRIIVDFQNMLPINKVRYRNLCIPTDTDLIVTLVGPRRTGKTFYFYHLINLLMKGNIKREQIIYINFEDERLEFGKKQLSLIFDAYFELFPNQQKPIYLFCDEIQEVDGWQKYIRRIYDSITKKIFLTGSSSKMLSSEIATSLRGRTIEYRMNPLHFDEYCRFKNVDYSDTTSTKNSALLKATFEQYLLNGGYPDLVNRDKLIRNKLLNSYFNTMIFKDLIERYDITTSHILKEFIKTLAASISSEFSINKIYNDFKSQGLKISKNRLYEFLEYCKNIFLFSVIEKYEYSPRKRRSSNKKIYFIDTGLLNSITFNFTDDLGKLLENLIHNQLMSKYDQIFYKKNGYECDFVVQDNKATQLIQVAYSLIKPQTKEREIKSLLKASENIPNAELLIVNIDIEEEILHNGKKIKIIPAWKWALNF